MAQNGFRHQFVTRLVSLGVIATLGLGLAASLSACGRKPSGGAKGLHGNMLTIKGSDTMVHLVSEWAEDYMTKHPGAQISVTGGGSGTGIAALINKTTDLAATSRDINAEETKLAARQGVKPTEHGVASDGIVLVVHPSNPVNALSMPQLKAMFTGKTKAWDTLGGPKKPVILFSRESSSGTYASFREHVLDKQDYADSARLMPSSSTIIDAVSQDQGGIGYVGLGYADSAKGKVKVLAVKPNDEGQAVMPTEESIRNGTYPISRPLYLYSQSPESELVQSFLTYTKSPEGQSVVTKAGYVSLK